MKSVATALLALLPLTASRTFAAGNTAIPIENIIVIVQENHSFDNYFGTYPGANGIPAGTRLPEVPGGYRFLAPFLATTTKTHDLSHSWVSAALSYDKGLMDGFYWAGTNHPQPITVRPLPLPELIGPWSRLCRCHPQRPGVVILRFFHPMVLSMTKTN